MCMRCSKSLISKETHMYPNTRLTDTWGDGEGEVEAASLQICLKVPFSRCRITLVLQRLHSPARHINVSVGA